MIDLLPEAEGSVRHALTVVISVFRVETVPIFVGIEVEELKIIKIN